MYVLFRLAMASQPHCGTCVVYVKTEAKSIIWGTRMQGNSLHGKGSTTIGFMVLGFKVELEPIIPSLALLQTHHMLWPVSLQQRG